MHPALAITPPALPSALHTRPCNPKAAVPDLIHYFEGLDTAIVQLSSSSSSPIAATMMTGHENPSYPSPFSSLRNSLAKSFGRPQVSDDGAAASVPQRSCKRSSTLPPARTGRSPSIPPAARSSFRAPSLASSRRARTWNTTHSRSRSRSRHSSHSDSAHSNSPILLSRRPSAIDLALLEEESLSHSVREAGLALDLMEPRPVPVVPVAVAFHHNHAHHHGDSMGSISSGMSRRSSIFEAPIHEEAATGEEHECEDDDTEVEEQQQPFVMGGILEVLEGTS